MGLQGSLGPCAKMPGSHDWTSLLASYHASNARCLSQSPPPQRPHIHIAFGKESTGDADPPAQTRLNTSTPYTHTYRAL